jgi:hypothetical protein
VPVLSLRNLPRGLLSPEMVALGRDVNLVRKGRLAKARHDREHIAAHPRLDSMFRTGSPQELLIWDSDACG